MCLITMVSSVTFLIHSFIHLFLHLSVCVYVEREREGEREGGEGCRLREVRGPPCGLPGSVSGHQSWWQAPPLAKSFLWSVLLSGFLRIRRTGRKIS